MFFSAAFFGGRLGGCVKNGAKSRVQLSEREQLGKDKSTFLCFLHLNKTIQLKMVQMFLLLISAQRASLFAIKSRLIGIAMATNGSYTEGCVLHRQL